MHRSRSAILVLGLVLALTTPAVPASAAPAAASTVRSPQAALQAPRTLRQPVYDLTAWDRSGKPLGSRLQAVYAALDRAGVHVWTVLGREDAAARRITVRMWHTSPVQAHAVANRVGVVLHWRLLRHQVYSFALLAPVRPGSPAARGDDAGLARVVRRLSGPTGFVTVFPDTVYVHYESPRLTTRTLRILRADAVRTAGCTPADVTVRRDP